MSKPRLLDLFCCAGGAAMGYHRAGFEVVGVDIAPQPRYPFEFHQADALEYLAAHGHEFDAVHASPPCQHYSTMRVGLWQDREHPDLIAPTRALLQASGKPYAIENVENARKHLINPIMLCGTMFGLGTKDGNQHNSYSAVPVYGGGQNGDYHNPPRKPKTVGVWGHSGGQSARDGVVQFNVEVRREAMGIEWMTNAELSEAIPPAYTTFIGKHLLAALAQEPIP
jgi:DNA (cytosine-5)-methyltransferase 1